MTLFTMCRMTFFFNTTAFDEDSGSSGQGFFPLLIPIITSLIGAASEVGSQLAQGKQVTTRNRAQLVSFQNQIGDAVGKYSDYIQAQDKAGTLTLPQLDDAIHQVTELRDKFYNYALNFGYDGQRGIATIGGPDGATNPGYVNGLLRWFQQKRAELMGGSTAGSPMNAAGLISKALGGGVTLWIAAGLIFLLFARKK